MTSRPAPRRSCATCSATRVSRPAGRDRRPRGRRRGCARAHAHRRRQVAVLSDSGAGARRRRRRRLAADRADAGPGGGPARSRRARGVPELLARRGPSSRRSSSKVRAGQIDLLYVAPERLVTERQARAAGSNRRSRCSPSTRRTACPSGATTSGRSTCSSRCWPSAIPGVPRIALTATADAATRQEILTRLKLERRARVHLQLRSPEHPLSDRGAGQSAQAAAAVHSRRARRPLGHRLLLLAQVRGRNGGVPRRATASTRCRITRAKSTRRARNT